MGAVSKFNSNPNEAHLTCVKRILRYLKGTADLALKYQKFEDGMVPQAYSDADWAGDVDARHSTTGNVIVMAGGAVSWLSKKQATVALSRAEAEYVALSSITQEAVWVRRLLSDIEAMLTGPTVIMEDNQGTLVIANNPIAHSRTKHTDIRYHFVREAVLNKTVELRYCPSEYMIADILTKPLPRERFETLRRALGIGRMN